ncbi:MAG: DJ-1/PfpI family protein [Bacteroidota bacterium]
MTRFLPLALAMTLAASSALAQTAPTLDEAQQTAPEMPGMTEQTHADLMATLGVPRVPIRTIGILVYDGVNELDLMGPRYTLGQYMGAQTLLIATEPGTVTTVMGVEIVPDTLMADVDALDVLVVPGGFTGTIETAYDGEILDWIRRIDQTTTYTAAVCTGTWILGATGLLDGRRATTNWYRAGEMMDRYGATFTDERFTQDGKYWTSAGVTAGMDMSIAMLADLWSEPYAQAIMLDMEYDPAPPVEGGSPETTAPEVFNMMQAMYDMGVQPLMQRLDAEAAASSTPPTDAN